MGTFDYIICEYPIDASENVLEWQTKDTPAQYLEVYTITKSGNLKDREGELINFRGEIIFYGHEIRDGKADYEKWWEYSALFDGGKLINLVRISPEPTQEGVAVYMAMIIWS